jgi:hypothetical protein
VKTIELYLIKTENMTRDYIEQNISIYNECKAKDWSTGKVFKLIPRIEKS